MVSLSPHSSIPRRCKRCRERLQQATACIDRAERAQEVPGSRAVLAPLPGSLGARRPCRRRTAVDRLGELVRRGVGRSCGRVAGLGRSTTAPCRTSCAWTASTFTSRSATPSSSACTAATPAASPIAQHSGISRSAACERVSADRLRPAASSPSSRAGTRLRYGISSVGNDGVIPGHSPMLSE